MAAVSVRRDLLPAATLTTIHGHELPALDVEAVLRDDLPAMVAMLTQPAARRLALLERNDVPHPARVARSLKEP